MPIFPQKLPQAHTVGLPGISGRQLDTAQRRAWMRDALTRHALDQHQHVKK